MIPLPKTVHLGRILPFGIISIASRDQPLYCDDYSLCCHPLFTLWPRFFYLFTTGTEAHHPSGTVGVPPAPPPIDSPCRRQCGQHISGRFSRRRMGVVVFDCESGTDWDSTQRFHFCHSCANSVGRNSIPSYILNSIPSYNLDYCNVQRSVFALKSLLSSSSHQCPEIRDGIRRRSTLPSVW